MKILLSASALTLGLAFGSAAISKPIHVPFPPEKPLTLAQNDVTSGGITRQLNNDDRRYMRRYRQEQQVPSVAYDGQLVIGDELPGDMTYYTVQERPSVSNYRYTVLNGRTVLVDRNSRRIIEVID